MKESNIVSAARKPLIFIFTALVLYLFLFPLQGLDTLYVYKTLAFDKWIEYRDSNLGLSLQYPKNPFISGDGFMTTFKGWTVIANCDSSKILIVGDKNQIFSVSICTRPSKSDIENILNNEEYKTKNIVINGKSYIDVSTEGERSRNLTGRYLISNNRDLLIGINRPPLSDETIWFNQAMNKIFLKIISSIKE